MADEQSALRLGGQGAYRIVFAVLQTHSVAEELELVRLGAAVLWRMHLARAPADAQLEAWAREEAQLDGPATTASEILEAPPPPLLAELAVSPTTPLTRVGHVEGFAEEGRAPFGLRLRLPSDWTHKTARDLASHFIETYNESEAPLAGAYGLVDVRTGRFYADDASLAAVAHDAPLSVSRRDPPAPPGEEEVDAEGAKEEEIGEQPPQLQFHEDKVEVEVERERRQKLQRARCRREHRARHVEAGDHRDLQVNQLSYLQKHFLQKQQMDH